MDTGNIDYEALLALALKAAEGSYAPYSKYCVGAAILAEDVSLYRLQRRKYLYRLAPFAPSAPPRSRLFRPANAVSGLRYCLPTDLGCLPCGICGRFCPNLIPRSDYCVRESESAHFAFL